MRTLHEILHAADGHYRNDEEKSNEQHSLLLNEIADGAAFPAAHLLRRNLRAPGEKVRADDEEEKHVRESSTLSVGLYGDIAQSAEPPHRLFRQGDWRLV